MGKRLDFNSPEWLLIDAQIAGREVLLAKGDMPLAGRSIRRALSGKSSERIVSLAREVVDGGSDIYRERRLRDETPIVEVGFGVWSEDQIAHSVQVWIGPASVETGKRLEAVAWSWNLTEQEAHWSASVLDMYGISDPPPGRRFRMHDLLSRLTVVDAIELTIMWTTLDTVPPGEMINSRFIARVRGSQRSTIHASGRIHDQGTQRWFRGTSIAVGAPAQPSLSSATLLESVLLNLPHPSAIIDLSTGDILRWIKHSAAHTQVDPAEAPSVISGRLSIGQIDSLTNIESNTNSSNGTEWPLYRAGKYHLQIYPLHERSALRKFALVVFVPNPAFSTPAAEHQLNHHSIDSSTNR